MTQTELLKEAARLLTAGYAADAKRRLETELPEALQESGRVLSAKSSARIKAALKELSELLDEATPPEPVPASEQVPATESLHELAEAEFLRESAAGKPPLMKLIAPGWGESGYYSAEMLRRDGPAAFPKGTLNLWNHLTEAQKQVRPEGENDNVASVLLEDARYLDQGPKGPGLYAPVKVFSDYEDRVKEKGPHLGVSINAAGLRKHGRVGDRDGMIVETLKPHKLNTVDFVTRAGAGGEVILQESAKPQQATTPGTAQAVTASEPIQEAAMPMDDREAEVLRESVANLTAKFNELAGKFGESQTENTQLRQHLNLREAKDVALGKLKTIAGLPDLLHDRIAESVSQNPPLGKDGQVNREAVCTLAEAGARKEMDLLSRLGLAGGRVTGLGGGSDEPDPAKLKESIQRRFQNIGLSESAATFATVGRGGR